MICLDNTDVIEGGASVDAVVDYQIHGLVGTTFTQLAAGVLSNTLTTALYTAGAAISVVSIILVNTHNAAVNVTLCLDPANGGNPRYLIPKAISLGIGYSLHTDGARITVMDTSGQIIHGYPSPLAVANGGTGASDLTDHGVLIGSGTGAITAMAALAAGSLIQGVSGADPAALAIGTAGQLLQVNAGATAAEWATFETAWQDYSGTSTIVGWSSYTTKQIYYKKIGSTVFVAFHLAGTSNSTSASFTLPYTSSNTVSNRTCAHTGDNGPLTTTGGVTILPPNSDTVANYKDMAAAGWTASGGKTLIGILFYDT